MAKVEHYEGPGFTVACGRESATAVTSDKDKVTCKGCQRTKVFRELDATDVKVLVSAIQAIRAESVRPVTVAPANTPCGWMMYGETGTKLTCESGKDAAHVLTETLPVAAKGTALCGFHSPYDVTDADRQAIADERTWLVESEASWQAATSPTVDTDPDGCPVTSSPEFLTMVADMIRDGALWEHKTHYNHDRPYPSAEWIAAGVASGHLYEGTGYVSAGPNANREPCRFCAKAIHGECERVSCPCRCKGDAAFRTAAHLGWAHAQQTALKDLTGDDRDHMLVRINNIMSNLGNRTDTAHGDAFFDACSRELKLSLVRDANRKILASESAEEIAARHKREIFRVGDPYTFRNLVGYKLYQDRPFACRGLKCQCGKACHGTTVESVEILADVAHYVSGGLEIRGDKGSRAVIRVDRLD